MAVWAHAAEAHSIEEDKRHCLCVGAAEAHGIEEDKRRCLWAGCGLHFAKPFEYRVHEGVHTGAVSDRNGCGLVPAEFCCRRAFAPLSTGDWQLASTVETGNWLIKIDAME